MKNCPECGADISELHYKAERCKPCAKERNRLKANKRRKDNYVDRWRTKDRDRYILRKFGLTPLEYQQMVENQMARCAICGRTPEEVGDGRLLAVDHDHDTGKIRGLLCRPCNTGIGQLGDSVDRVRKALNYLENNL